MDNSNALISILAIGMSLILSGEQVAVEKSFQLREIDAVIFDIRATLPLVPCVHANTVYALCICRKGS